MRILFICRQNAARSQIAAGFARDLIAERALPWEVLSAGSEPADRVNPGAIQAMSEVGIDISSETPRLLTAELAASVDHVVAVCGEDACPYIAGADYWGIEDPAGRGEEKFREVRELVRERVEELVSTLST